MQTHGFAFRGIPVHYVELGDASAPALMLLHGSGAGASTIGNWRKVLAPLADAGFHVFAMDLIGFGESGRKPHPPYFDIPLWLAQCQALLERIPHERVGLIGHSLSGALALRLAAMPGNRAARVMTTAAMGASFAATAATREAWVCPADMAQLRAVARYLISDETQIDQAYLDHRAALLFDGDYRDYYGAMFSGDRQQYIDAAEVRPDELRSIGVEVLLLHGMDDLAFPAEPLSIALGRALPNADVVLLSHCSHSVAFEQPEKFLRHATSFFSKGTP